MAYAALVSLANTINRILNSNLYPISLEEKQQTFSLLEYVTLLQDFLEIFADKFTSMEGRMRDLANEAQDILEYHVLEKVFSSSVEDSGWHLSGKHQLQLENVIKEMDLIAGEVKEIKDSSGSKDVERAADSSALSLSSSPAVPPIRKGAMVGFQDYVIDIKERLFGESSKLQVIPVCGMGGIGKTTLARNVYDDPFITSHFDICVWVTVSQDYSVHTFLSSLMESLKKFDTSELKGSDDEKVHKILMGRRYLVVVDDIWSSEAWDEVRKVFPDDSNGSRIMLTTRLSDVASYPDPSSKVYEMGLLNADESWNLLKQEVFADEDCPSKLENIGKEIARRCKGLPLAIVVIAGLLSTVSKNVASWKEIAENVKSAETAEHDQIEGILSLSYIQLPQYLRPCFLYMGSFPEDDEIHVSRLIRLWIAEGFVKSPIDSESFEKVGEELFEELVKRNLVLVTKRRSDGRIKGCSLHDLMRDLCIRKAHESEFFLNVMDRRVTVNSSYLEKKRVIESMKNQRRVGVNSSYLSYLSSSTIRSIKCSKHGVVKLDFLKRVRLVRVLDLDTELANVECSPNLAQLHELFHLRYLAIRYCHDIPGILLNLQNLETLIIHGGKRYQLGTQVDGDLWLSWCMPQLRHVYFYGTIRFDDPKETASSLESLQTLSHVSHWSCTERILKMIPNLRSLKIDCSGRVHRGAPACLNDLVHLNRLENLEIYAGRLVRSRPKYYSFSFPRMLKRLTLKDLEFLWNDMVVVGSLPNLQVLKLKGCTCIGGTWETTEGSFPALEILLIEAASEFRNWIAESSHFPRLKRLLLRSCGNLYGISNDIGEIPTLELIELKGYAQKSLVESVEQIRNEQEELGNNALQVICTANSS